ncbi:unnamed protein product [Rhizophagus irregularis]|nr:unnamed protein product [Rhizophagus irregularis]
MNNFIEKILILILVFTTITFAVPLNYDQEACPIGFGRCIDGSILKNPILKEPTIKGPGSSPVWKGLNSFRGQTKTRGTGKNKQYLEWDFTHNDIEVYDNKGKHLGSIDPSSGNMVKPPLYIYSILVQPLV